MDYDSIESRPDQDGWVQFLRDRICFSFQTIKRLGGNTKEGTAYELSKPILDINFKRPNPFNESHNFWLRGLAFYAAGKIIGADEVAGIMNQFRIAQVMARINAQPLPSETNGVWNSIQIERMFRLLNINRLDSERAMTAHFMQALEFIIKAALTHCNYYHNKMFYFQDGHELIYLYDALPDSCRCEIERAANEFFDDFEIDRTKAMDSARRAFGPDGFESSPNDGDDVGSIIHRAHEFNDLMAGRKYLDMWSENAPHRQGKLEDWVRESLRMSGNLMSHRYGPTPRRNEGPISATDPYSTDAVGAAETVARFFLEYLFGWETIVTRHSTLGNAGGTS